jgi:hypothetical protein
VTVLKTESPSCFRDLLENLAPHGDVVVLGLASGVWLPLFDIQIGG